MASLAIRRATNCHQGAAAIQLLLAYYADDFTGATDALEALTLGGVETALFVDPPDSEMLSRYSRVRAIGVAGNSRAMSPSTMGATLSDVFQELRGHGPPIVHYKVCSTFDSSPDVGSIGRAIELGQRCFSNRYVPMVVGAPRLQRFCVFGNLFARSGLDSALYRLDRHPTMRRHPVTPMTEADLRIHLARQTSQPVELIDVLTLKSGYESSRDTLLRLTEDAGRIVLFDSLDDDDLALAGRLILESQSLEGKSLFVVGSSGIENALIQNWQAMGTVLSAPRIMTHKAELVDRALVVSGSCSPVTKRQIAWALENGYEEARLDLNTLCHSPRAESELLEIVRRTHTILEAGQSAIVHTYRDLTASSNGKTGATFPPNGVVNQLVGSALGRILCDVVRTGSVERVAVIGGDTSGGVARATRIESLSMLAPLEPGAPLCVARSRDADIDGLEIVFKGGQVGHDCFFGSLVGGRSGRTSVEFIP